MRGAGPTSEVKRYRGEEGSSDSASLIKNFSLNIISEYNFRIWNGQLYDERVRDL
jgi:hypothetical protein